MEIRYSPNLIPFLKNKQLLLDTNVFRDVASKPTVYTQFFNLLKQYEVTIVTIDLVKYELLKGSIDEKKYKAKENFILSIIDLTIPLNPAIYDNTYTLIQKYGIDGTALNITDLFLGAMLMQYKNNLCLMTRDTTDFMQNIFDVPHVINVPYQKGIFTYGIYQYTT